MVTQRTEWAHFQRWLWRIAITATVAAVLGGLAGGVMVLVTMDAMDGWRDLAALAAAAVTGAVGALVAGVVGVVLLVLRFAPRGRRAPVLGWTLVVVVGVILVGGAAARFAPVPATAFGDPTVITVLAAVAALVLTPVILLARRERDRLQAAVRGATIHPDGGSSPPQ